MRRDVQQLGVFVAPFDARMRPRQRLVEIVAESGKTLRELLSDVPQTFATPEIRVDCPDAVKFAVVADVVAHYRGKRPVLDIDGGRVDFDGGAWGLCRASNTQPVLVLRFEARTEERLAEVRREVEGVVEGAIRRALGTS